MEIALHSNIIGSSQAKRMYAIQSPDTTKELPVTYKKCNFMIVQYLVLLNHVGFQAENKLEVELFTIRIIQNLKSCYYTYYGICELFIIFNIRVRYFSTTSG